MGTIKRNFYNNITPTGKFDATDLTGTVPADNIANASMTNVTSVPASVGDFVQKVSSDPSPASAGDVWYNTTSNALKSVVSLAAWSSGADMATGRTNTANAGTLTAALAVGGNTPPVTSATELYNGTGWATDSATLNTGRISMGSASNAPQTAAIIYGGQLPGKTAVTEEYNGTTWTEVADLSTARWGGASFGNSQTAAVMAGGDAYPPTTGRYKSETEEFNGTSWSSGGSLGTEGTEFMGSGIESAGLVAGGEGGRPNTSVEEYNGTSWSAGGNMPIGRTSGAMAGTQTASIQYGGVSSPTPVATTITYDGSAWTTTPSMAVAKYAMQTGAGSSTAAISTGSHPAQPPNAQTEEYNVSTNVITPAAWASGGNLNTARQRTGGFGSSQTSAVTAAGATAPPASSISATEEYNGSTWTSTNNVNTGRFNMAAFGTEPAGVISGIGTPSVSYGGTTEEYNGSTWTTVTSYSSPDVNYRSSCGTQTAGLLSGGVRSPATPAENSNLVEEYDGTSWTSGTNLPQYQAYNNQAGTQTAAINGGGGKSPDGVNVSPNTISLEYDGSTWTAGPNANLFSDNLNAFNGGIGTQTSAMFSGGSGTGTVRYDGTTFATDASIAAARGELSAAGNSPASAGIVYCGSPVPSVGNTTEEYTGETTAANVKTISTS